MTKYADFNPWDFSLGSPSKPSQTDTAPAESTSSNPMETGSAANLTTMTSGATSDGNGPFAVQRLNPEAESHFDERLRQTNRADENLNPAGEGADSSDSGPLVRSNFRTPRASINESDERLKALANLNVPPPDPAVLFPELNRTTAQRKRTVLRISWKFEPGKFPESWDTKLKKYCTDDYGHAFVDNKRKSLRISRKANTT
jgi:hypothetical protein